MLKVYNTLTREKEEFIPLKEDKVGMYVCGLTVQNYSHLGHIRSAINYDVIRRYLEYKGYDVTYIMNFTDVNEKIVARAAEEGLTMMELAEKYARAYLEDIAELNIKPATRYVKATDNIDAIIKMIATLLERGYAYEVNGNVYFSVDKFEDYGKLSGRSLDEMQAGARLDVVEEKRNPMDFALWKKAPEGEKEWDSPWGKGWPGWHIECSAMSTKYLGDSFDIHGGGSDLIFPHHENEIAQSEACTGHTFAKYWLHNGPVNLKGEKMSKSLGNFFTTRELLEKYKADEIRYFLLTKNYRTPIDFSEEEMETAKVGLKRLSNLFYKLESLLFNNEHLEEVGGDLSAEGIMDKCRKRRVDFKEAMNDDFNTALAIGVIHELVRDINSFINSPDFILQQKNCGVIKEVYGIFKELVNILGLSLDDKANINNDEAVNNLMDFILKIREEAREQRDYQLADRIRDGLDKLGFLVKDTPQGVEWERVQR
ncbi:MAG: cysteine--tRNA ligase [Firmicutes bacterium]|nr:cysteine--tRNA ligase [Bacillota bacterium]